MRDYWMRCADQAVEEGNVRKLIFSLGMACDMMRLEHDNEIRDDPSPSRMAKPATDRPAAP